ncbi:MAG: NADH-quinone oxidoreductase subunit L [Burkholderiales bacterium]
MLAAALGARFPRVSVPGLWRGFLVLSGLALVLAAISAVAGPGGVRLPAGLQASPLGLGIALLVQLLGTVIGGFSARYLQGESGQRRYVAALAIVLAAVHLLLMADHWVVLIAAWALVGAALQRLLCFYPDRPFARLAAHKKRIADRVADGLLVAAAALAWIEVGSGSLSDLWAHVAREGLSVSLQLCAVALVLAVILRTALLPVHGWLIQVMEAPTPVSALLHAGVVNLGGFVLIRFAPLLELATSARVLLVVFGLGTALLAGMVMLTRISIKVRLAWSTVAQMGFMLLECGLGLYTFAALHLIGHSLYKAHAFLSASTVVRETRLRAMHGSSAPSAISLALAPVVAIAAVMSVQSLTGSAAWPWWWSALLGLAWAPVLWLPAAPSGVRALGPQVVLGVLMVAGLAVVAALAHALPLGLHDVPHRTLGLAALTGMVALYVCLTLLQLAPRRLSAWRRWSYAGFYVDEAYTRLALQIWPARWTGESSDGPPPEGSPVAGAATN